MALQQVNFGSASDGSQGDTARAAFGKINANFSDTTNAASRLVGIASGQVMEVGAFGLGQTLATANSADLNTYQIAGQRIFTSSSAANAPVADFGYLEVNGVGDAANRVAQTWTHYNANRRFTRVLAGSGWTAWKEVAMSGDSPSFVAIRASGEIISTSGNALRSVAGNFGAIVRNDGTNLYMLMTNSGDPNGSFNSLRPLTLNLASGSIIFGHSISVSGQATFSAPLRPAQYTMASLPSASAFTGYEIDVTDAAGGAKRCRSDGSAWKILNTTTTVS